VRYHLVPPEVYRDVREDRRGDPDGGYHESRATSGHKSVVVERSGDVDIAVDTDAAEVQEGDGREEDVVGVEHVAGGLAEQPPTGDLLGGAQGHHEQCDEQVGEGQGDEERVGD